MPGTKIFFNNNNDDDDYDDVTFIINELSPLIGTLCLEMSEIFISFLLFISTFLFLTSAAFDFCCLFILF